jgi:adenylate cyclase class IV
MNLTDIQIKMEELRELVDRLGGLLCEIDEVNDLCRSLDIEESHHASMEYCRSMEYAEDALESLEIAMSRLKEMGV